MEKMTPIIISMMSNQKEEEKEKMKEILRAREGANPVESSSQGVFLGAESADCACSFPTFSLASLSSSFFLLHSFQVDTNKLTISN